MKVNPIGIQSYQQVNRQSRPEVQPEAHPDKGGVSPDLTITPQATVEKPALSVKGPSGDYGKYLSTEEKQALDQLFIKYQENGRFGSSYQSGTGKSGSEDCLGRTVDVKV